MKSNLFKALLLPALLTITAVSFFHRRRVMETPPESHYDRPAWRPAALPPPPPAAPWTEKWDSYVYAGEQFSVEMPAMPFAYESSRRVGPFGNVEPVRTFGLYSDGVVLLVTSFANPGEGETHEYFASYHWDGVAFAYAGDVKAGVPRGKGYMLGGKEYRFSGEYYTRARVFVERERAHLVCAMSFEPDNPRALHFLDSFDFGIDYKAKEIHDPPPSAVGVPAGPPVTSETPGVSVSVSVNAGEGVGPGSGVHGETPTPAPFKGGEVTRKAVVVFKPPPGFTEEARKNEVTGAVRLRAVLTADGKVGNVSVIKGLSHGLTEKAVDSARHILFFPALKGGRAVSQYVTLEYNFNIY
ncbi:MAG TPA: energy transducer TonB [Pyrinomonadaceae bacterium]|jgi:TonB family protein|nr:energy transducer TonB [Pyrinomonadaceae bacterium]